MQIPAALPWLFPFFSRIFPLLGRIKKRPPEKPGGQGDFAGIRVLCPGKQPHRQHQIIEALSLDGPHNAGAEDVYKRQIYSCSPALDRDRGPC